MIIIKGRELDNTQLDSFRKDNFKIILKEVDKFEPPVVQIN